MREQWINHYAIFRLIARVDHPMLMMNLIHLLGVAFLPYPTVGRPVRDPARTRAHRARVGARPRRSVVTPGASSPPA
ncbi:MAG TPA: TMEM175 family protein [Chloroflexota bacterium]|nr:TMEM175 family protein [Chloroflexota bacterium]